MTKTPFHDILNATLRALHELGDSGRNQEIHDKAVEILGLSEEEIAKPLKPDQSTPTEIAYRLGWARTYLKHYGIVHNSRLGVWALTVKGKTTTEVDGKDVERVFNEKSKQKRKAKEAQGSPDSDDTDEQFQEGDDLTLDEAWRDQLHSVLTSMDPTAFERLCQRVLRESGFTKVEVTSASHDGGIDGKGILQVNDFLTFRVEFQCKRYSGSVGPDVVQKLRGAMSGSADRGLIVTTGSFTQGAKREANHEFKVPIELVDGDELINKLKELELGVATETVEKVTVDPDFFKKF